jgi:neutral ceramidase
MSLKAGFSTICITPSTTQFLDGYPLGLRFSTGVDTDLFSSSLYVENNGERWLAIGLDLLFVDKDTAMAIRRGIESQTGLSAERILVAATHTHSAPVSRGPFPFYRDDQRRHPDHVYLQQVIDRTILSGLEAVANARPAKIGFGLADSSEVGGNRRVAGGTADLEVPVLAIREVSGNTLLGVLLIVSVHPTVLHEDSTVISGDFPGHARKMLQQRFGGIPVVYLTGAAGNQSPRYYAHANTVAEASRLGGLLADSVIKVIEKMDFETDPQLAFARTEVAHLPFNHFPAVSAALEREECYRVRFEEMRAKEGNTRATRTAETDWFGATRMRQLAELKASGDLERESAGNCLPAEIQLFRIGESVLVTWPGEVFVEYALALRERFPRCRLITYANGHTQGYLVTAEAVAEGGYEASAATFKSPESPQILFQATVELLSAGA